MRVGWLDEHLPRCIFLKSVRPLKNATESFVPVRIIVVVCTWHISISRRDIFFPGHQRYVQRQWGPPWELRYPSVVSPCENVTFTNDYTRDSTIFPHEKLDYPFQCWTTKMCQWNMVRRCISQEKPREISSLMLVAPWCWYPHIYHFWVCHRVPQNPMASHEGVSSRLKWPQFGGRSVVCVNPLWFMIESPVHHFEWFQSTILRIFSVHLIPFPPLVRVARVGLCSFSHCHFSDAGELLLRSLAWTNLCISWGSGEDGVWPTVELSWIVVVPHSS